MSNIPIISGLEYVGNPNLDNGKANFIQIYLPNKTAVFRAGYQSHASLLENFVKESGLKREDLDWCGGGQISKAHFISGQRNKHDYCSNLSYQKAYVLNGQCGAIQKFPNQDHLDEIKRLFLRDVTILCGNYDNIKFTNDDNDDIQYPNDETQAFLKAIDDAYPEG